MATHPTNAQGITLRKPEARTAFCTAKVRPSVKQRLEQERAKQNIPMSEYLSNILEAHLNALE